MQRERMRWPDYKL